MDFLEHLRTRSPETKSRYAFLFAFLTTGVVGFMWMIALPARFNDGSTVATDLSDPTKTELPDIIDEGKRQLGSIIEGAIQAESVTTHTTHEMTGSAQATSSTQVATSSTQTTPTTSPTSTPKTIAIPVEKPKPTTPSNQPSENSPKNAFIQIATTSVPKTE